MRSSAACSEAVLSLNGGGGGGAGTLDVEGVMASPGAAAGGVAKRSSGSGFVLGGSPSVSATMGVRRSGRDQPCGQTPRVEVVEDEADEDDDEEDGPHNEDGALGGPY